MNWFLRYLTSNDPKRTVTKTGRYFRKAIYPLVRRLSGPLTDVEGIMVKAEPMPTGPLIFAVTHQELPDLQVSTQAPGSDCRSHS